MNREEKERDTREEKERDKFPLASSRQCGIMKLLQTAACTVERKNQAPNYSTKVV